MEEVIKDWDVEHLLCSHTDPLFGNAKERLKQLLKEFQRGAKQKLSRGD